MRMSIRALMKRIRMRIGMELRVSDGMVMRM